MNPKSKSAVKIIIIGGVLAVGGIVLSLATLLKVYGKASCGFQCTNHPFNEQSYQLVSQLGVKMLYAGMALIVIGAIVSAITHNTQHKSR
jgi:hypothetical protein